MSINGSVDVYNQCDATDNCIALNNFWRSLSNLTINVDRPRLRLPRRRVLGGVAGRADAPGQRQRRTTTLMDYCTGPSFASGGFIADSQFDGSIVNGSQQQWLVRNSVLDGWSNGVWNQVFSGVLGAPAQCFPAHRPAAGRTRRWPPAR